MWTKVNNKILEAFLTLSKAESAVLAYVVSNTTGAKEKTVKASAAELAEITNNSRPSIQKAIKSLEEAGYICVVRGKGHGKSELSLAAEYLPDRTEHTEEESQILEAFNDTFPELAKSSIISASFSHAIEAVGVKKIVEAIHEAGATPFFRGENPSNWKVTIEYFTNPAKIKNILKRKESKNGKHFENIGGSHAEYAHDCEEI